MPRISRRQRVANGIAYLNKRRRSNSWMKKIDLESLNMNDPKKCILGQLTGNFYHPDQITYSYNMSNKNMTWQQNHDRIVKLGLMPIDGDDTEQFNWGGKLTKEWQKQIKAARLFCTQK